ncbi:egg cell-secreted protein 1.2-like [Cornus florida]|uniref:egg cell-secreted protein 1.2-like n=1 Tax=Cornus florida TaxID=4283 RepID=UPI00289E2C14|nr:egg cell-secreted protein 1.2-like [Cornus florida]
MVAKLYISLLISSTVACICMATSEPARLAADPPADPPNHEPIVFHGPVPLPPIWANHDIMHCWSPIIQISGCVTQVYEALLKGQFTSLLPECCEAVYQIVDDCWPSMFPFHPEFAPLIKDYCGEVGTKAPPGSVIGV